MTRRAATRSITDIAAHLLMLVLAIALSSAAAEQAEAQGQAETRAGTAIDNVAQARGTAGGRLVSALSDTVTLLVVERLDVALSRGDRAGARGATDALALPATLVNRGNGGEAFALAASGPAGATIRGIAIDTDGDGAYDPARDTPLAGGVTPSIPPGGSLALLVLVDGAAAAGSVVLTARAVTGSGTSGTGFPGAGDGGAEAVVGPTGGAASVALPIDPAPMPVLRKSQAVRAPGGGEQPVRGAVVTYTLQAQFAASRQGAAIDDPVPIGTRYVPGSLTLDGAGLTDAADGDAGGCDGTRVAVSLGDVAVAAGAAPVTRTVRFQVVLQ